MKKLMSLFVAILVLGSATASFAHIDIPEITRSADLTHPTATPAENTK